MKKIICITILLSSFTLLAQKEANNWFFGIGAGIHFQDDGSVNILTGSPIETNEGCSSISDINGNLLFYTDGRNVWDRNHILMPNGNYLEGTGLLGDPSSTQSAVIVPKKGDDNIYYIFTVDEPHHENAAVYPNPFLGPYEDGGSIPTEDDGLNNGFNYSIVDLSITGPNGSIGDITTRNTHLLTYNPIVIDEAKYKCSEKVTALKNSTGSGYWVITHFVDKFYAFQVDANGVNETPVITQITPIVPTSGYRRNAIGCLKASPNGKKLAIAHQQVGTVTGDTETNGTVVLYDFDNATGIISNAVVLSENSVPYGVEFSQKSRKLYISYDNQNAYSGVYQYDLLSADIPASGIQVGTTPQSGTLQLGPNGKIYRARVSTSFLDVINAPDEDGNACNYVNSQQSLGTAKAFFGLPPFITSYFSVSIVSTKKCLGDTTEFALNIDDAFDTVVWDFGDATPVTAASSSVNTTHQYALAGTYTVLATVTHQGDVSLINTTVTIVQTPVVASQPNTINTCDPDNDGITVFDLSQNTAIILGTQSNTVNSVKYFSSLPEATGNTNALNETAYTNHTNPETIYARLQNSASPECFQVVSFQINALKSPVTNAVEQALICLNNPAGLTLSAVNTGAANYTYSWSTGATTNKIVVKSQGSYTVTITNSVGCSSMKTFIVVPSDVAIIDDVIIADFRESNTVTIMASPPAGVSTQYGYSLDMPNGPYQESNIFENVSAGIHTIYVSDVQGCGVVYKEITVLSAPKFFTPNEDGTNDTWNIIGVNAFFYPNSKIYVFDRYGKLLAGVDPKGNGWDGNFNGHRLPADDYWYVIALDDGRTIKGHFSLIR